MNSDPANPQVRRNIYERDGGLCGFCGQLVPFEKMHLDHIVPQAMHGPTTEENLRPSHARCNLAAGAKLRALLHPPREVTVVQLRLPEDLHDDLVRLAQDGDRSLNAQIVRLLRRSVEREKTFPDTSEN